MTTNIAISINVDPSSELCNDCIYWLEKIGTQRDGYCEIFTNEVLLEGNRCELCLSAQKQAEPIQADMKG